MPVHIIVTIVLLFFTIVAIPLIFEYQKPASASEFNYETLRILIGFIAIAISIVVAVVASVSGLELNSISAAWHTDGRDLFVGSLLVVGAFLLAYKGGSADRATQLESHPKIWVRGWAELLAARIGALSITMVALLPTDDCPAGSRNNSCSVPSYLGLDLSQTSDLHFIGAITFFVCLFVFMIVFLLRVWSKIQAVKIQNEQHKQISSRYYLTPIVRAGIYTASLMIMLVGVAISLWSDANNSLFYTEFLVLFGFGVAWILAGIRKDGQHKERWST